MAERAGKLYPKRGDEEEIEEGISARGGEVRRAQQAEEEAPSSSGPSTSTLSGGRNSPEERAGGRAGAHLPKL